MVFILALACRLRGGEWMATSIEAPTYPPLGTQARIEGVVKLRLALAKDGKVLRADVLSGNGVLADSAKANVLTWRFLAPCSTEGAPPPTIEFTYDFKLIGEVTDRPRTSFHYEHPYKVPVTARARPRTP